MAFPALLDTCSLWGAYLCDTLLSIAAAGAYRPLWSAAILEELHQGLVEHGIDEDAVKRRISDMRRVFSDAEVMGYESLIDSMTCDAKDRHVLAAAVRARPAMGNSSRRAGGSHLIRLPAERPSRCGMARASVRGQCPQPRLGGREWLMQLIVRSGFG